MKRRLSAALAATVVLTACGGGGQSLDDARADGELWLHEGVDSYTEGIALECNFPLEGEGIEDPKCWVAESSRIPDGDGPEPGEFMEPTEDSCEGGEPYYRFGVPSGRNTVAAVVDGYVVPSQHLQSGSDFLAAKGICGYELDPSRLVSADNPEVCGTTHDGYDYRDVSETWGQETACVWGEDGYVEQLYPSVMHKAIAQDSRWETLEWSTPYRWNGQELYGTDAYFIAPALLEGWYTEADIPEALELAGAIPSADWSNICSNFNLNYPAGDGRHDALGVFASGRASIGGETYDGSDSDDRVVSAILDVIFIVCGQIHEVAD